MLSCECGDFDYEPGMVFWYQPNDYQEYPERRRARCCSCKTLVSPGDTCLKFSRFKVPEYEVEVKIYCEDGEIPRAPWWMCEECGDLYWSLTELGYCFEINTPMRQLAREAAEISAGLREAT